MRLIHADSYEIREFFGFEVPPYAILSHTWSHDEVSFQDMARVRLPETDAGKSRIELNAAITSRKGFKKVKYACQQALRDGLEWIWVDTCCIDKTSSAELSEAINSMFKWYRYSIVCYSYLADVSATLVEGPKPLAKALPAARWFTRGWTLQELIAPPRLEFYDHRWVYLGLRSDLRDVVSAVTKIPMCFLDHAMEGPHGQPGLQGLSAFSVAQKMSWAADRICTRAEDTAYCLLGLFDINMPLLYGEGDKAFARLQEEIFRTTDDHSILAWTTPKYLQQLDIPHTWTLHGAFAESPAHFYQSGNIRKLYDEHDEPSVLTKRGLQMTVSLLDYPAEAPWSFLRRYKAQNTQLVALNCGTGDKLKRQSRVVLLVVRDYASYEPGRDGRVQPAKLLVRLCTPYNLLLDTRHVNSAVSGKDQQRWQQRVYMRTSRHIVSNFVTYHQRNPWTGFKDNLVFPMTIISAAGFNIVPNVLCTNERRGSAGPSKIMEIVELAASEHTIWTATNYSLAGMLLMTWTPT